MTKLLCVYCSSSRHLAPSYYETAAAVGRDLAERGWGLIWKACVRSFGESAEDGVDHARGELLAGLLGQFHAFIDGGTRGDAVHVQNLECTQAEQDEDFRIEFGVGVSEQSPDLVVEADLPAEDAEDHGCDQISIEGRESADGFVAQQVVSMRAVALDCHENYEGRLASW